MLRCVSLIIAVAAFFGCAALADDYPQFRGTHRTGVFDETGLMKAWPEGGPPLAWVAKGVGAGFSSAAVRDGKIYVTGTLADQESFVFILDLDGKELARIPYGKESTAEMAPCARSTPTLDGDRLYFLASLGQATCIDHVKKEVVWQVNILDRFKGPNNEWHLSENLLVDGDRLIVTPGGPDASIAALNKMTGETLWTGPVTGKAYGLAAASETLFVSTDQGTLHAFRQAPASTDTTIASTAKPESAPPQNTASGVASLSAHE